MPFMNEYEIEDAARHFRHHPVFGKATKFLRDYCAEVNAHSDGWPYWHQPTHAAAKLMTLIHDAYNSSRFGGYSDKAKFDAIDDKTFRATLAPIRAFYTKRGNAAGMVFPLIDDGRPAQPNLLSADDDTPRQPSLF